MRKTKKTASYIRDIDEWNGEAKLYKLSEPLEGYSFVVVSSVVVMFSGPETYVFPSNKNGEVTDWRELKGSYKGDLNHEKALKNAGYKVLN